MPSAANITRMLRQHQRPKKISAKISPLITEKELLTTIPTSISYSTQSHYDFFNHGKSRFPSRVFHWENFIEMVNEHPIESITEKYEKPSIPLSHTPISSKDDLIHAIDSQIVRSLTSKFNHDDLELCKTTENVLIDWIVINECDQTIASIGIRTHRVLRTKEEDDVIEAYQQNTGDFADNVNEVYDYMCEFGLKYSLLSTYEFTWFLKRSDKDPSVLLISKCQRSDSDNPTLLQSYNYLMYLSKKEPLLAPCPVVIPSYDDNFQNTEYFDQSYPPESSNIAYRKRQLSDEEEGDYEFKKFRYRGNLSDEISYRMNWNNVIIKGNICGDIYFAEYGGEHLHLKSVDGFDLKKKITLEKEAQIHTRLSSLQGVYIPRVKYNDITLNGEKYVFATEYIRQTSTLLRKHKEDALRAIKAIHSLGIIHNNVKVTNFIVGCTNDDNSRENVFIIDFCLSKDFKEEQRVQLSSYHIHMEKEKEKVEELFEKLPI